MAPPPSTGSQKQRSALPLGLQKPSFCTSAARWTLWVDREGQKEQNTQTSLSISVFYHLSAMNDQALFLPTCSPLKWSCKRTPPPTPRQHSQIYSFWVTLECFNCFKFNFAFLFFACFKVNVGDPWVAQRFGACLWPSPPPAFGDPGDPGSNPTSGSRCMEPASPSACVSASLLSLCDYHK